MGANMTLQKINSLHYQRGVSKFGLLMLFLLLVSILTIGLKVVPIYVDHNLISGICEELIESGEASNLSTNDLRSRVGNTLRINNVRDFDLSDITMRKENGQAIITIAYERRVELVGNLDIVATFETILQ
jgi:hypothetical protein